VADREYDWLVIGSGFGGSVAALRLAEKGHRVAVLECGRRFRDEDCAESAWQLRRYFWMPRLACPAALATSSGQPVADDHRAGRARDQLRARGRGRGRCPTRAGASRRRAAAPARGGARPAS